MVRRTVGRQMHSMRLSAQGQRDRDCAQGIRVAVGSVHSERRGSAFTADCGVRDSCPQPLACSPNYSCGRVLSIQKHIRHHLCLTHCLLPDNRAVCPDLCGVSFTLLVLCTGTVLLCQAESRLWEALGPLSREHSQSPRASRWPLWALTALVGHKHTAWTCSCV